MVDHKPENVAMTDQMSSVMRLLILSPIRYPSALDERGMPRKSGVFLYGPPGGGKTMVKSNALYLSARLGATAIDVDPSTGIEGFAHATSMAKRLLDDGHKVVIAMEDMEKLAVRDRAKVLDLLDGTSSKQNRVIYVGTTNFIESIDRAMLRPGRFDAVVECALPDLSAFTQLVNVLIKPEDRGIIDYAEAFPYFEGYSYAFIANAVQLIIRAAIDRAKGDLDEMSVNTQDLIDAAMSVRGHHELMQEQVKVEPPKLEALYREISNQAIEDYLENNSVMTENDNTDYDEIVGDVLEELLAAAERVERAGVPKACIWLDPGLGFAKTSAQSVELLSSLGRFQKTGYRVLVGPSRKSFIAELAPDRGGGRPSADQRLGGTAAAVAVCAAAGVEAIRGHDVYVMRQVVAVTHALRSGRGGVP